MDGSPADDKVRKAEAGLMSRYVRCLGRVRKECFEPLRLGSG